MPRVARHAVNKMLETAELDVGQSDPRIMKSTGPAKASIDPPQLVEVADKPVDKEWMDMVAFSQEMVTININPSTEKNAEDPIFVGNNGSDIILPNGERTKWLKRNTDYTIERRFVESLARAKVTTYTQRDDVAPDGTTHKIMIPHTACRYPFRVVHDPHPRGADWLKAILAEKP